MTKCFSKKKEKNISDVTLPLPCIVCSKKLEPAFRGDSTSTQPLNALAFEGRGAYGSEFDPMDGRLSLLINVCDECLKTKGEEGSVVMVTQERPKLPAPTFEAYRP
jgi:hypothetical protein